MSTKNNRIWIELDSPKGQGEEFAKLQCELANNMMRRLGVTDGYRFIWMKKYGYCWDGPAGFEELTDNGKWFNLDYLAGAAQ